MKTQRKTILLLAFALLLSMACTLADISTARIALRAAALDTDISPIPTTDLSTPRSAPEDKPTDFLSTHTVCTKVPNGRLRVRETAGTASAVIAVLDEGTPVIVLNEIQQDKGIWAEISVPNGWVNIRYLCKNN